MSGRITPPEETSSEARPAEVDVVFCWNPEPGCRASAFGKPASRSPLPLREGARGRGDDPRPAPPTPGGVPPWHSAFPQGGREARNLLRGAHPEDLPAIRDLVDRDYDPEPQPVLLRIAPRRAA